MSADLCSEPRKSRSKPRGSLVQATEETLFVKKGGWGNHPTLNFFVWVITPTPFFKQIKFSSVAWAKDLRTVYFEIPVVQNKDRRTSSIYL